MKHIILVNPTSGNKRGTKKAIIVQKLLKKYNIDSEIFESHYEGELTDISKKLSSNENCRFYCIGGDGTLNEIVSGIIGTESEIVVLPCGTGNDFSRFINPYKSLRKIVISSINSKVSKYDVIKINRNRYCFNILNIGFDAMVAQNMNKFRWIPFISGTGKYNLAIVYTLFQNKNFKLRIRTNKFIEERKFTLIALSNGKYYGGGVIPSPNAIPNDNKLSICAIDSTSILTKIVLLSKYKNCKHEEYKIVNINDDITDFSIVSSKVFPFSTDGEIGFTNRIKGKIIPSAINIVTIKK